MTNHASGDQTTKDLDLKAELDGEGIPISPEAIEEVVASSSGVSARLVEITGVATPEFWSGVIASVAAALILAILGFVTARLWEFMQPNMRGWLGKLACHRPFRWLALPTYRRNVQDAYGTVTNIYLDQREKLDLDQIFVPLTLRRQGQSTTSHLHQRTTRQILTDNEHRRLVILGDPGSGKTTMMKAVAAGVALRQWPELKQLVPVFVTLRSYAVRSSEEPLFDYLAREVLPNLGLPLAESILRSLIDQRRLLLILDGLDEVDEDQLDALGKAVTFFLEDHDPDSHLRVFATCREQNYSQLHDPDLLRNIGFRDYRLGSLSDREVDEMVAKRSVDFEREKKSQVEFLSAIRERDRVSELHRNPLLLTLSIALYLHRPQQNVPQSLSDFYKESIEHLLKRHDFPSQRGVTRRNNFSTPDKFQFLRSFALDQLIKARKANRDFGDFGLSDLIEHAEGHARQSVNIRPEQADAFIREVHLNAGLISKTGEGDLYAFAHRSFHEFCAAQELVRQGDAGLQTVLDNALDPLWRQTILFYAGADHPSAENLVTDLLARAMGKPAALSLAAECAALLAQPLVYVRRRVVDAVVEEIERVGSDRHQSLLIALVHLGRDTPTEIQAVVREELSKLLALENPVELVRELGRLHVTTAISLLDVLTASDQPDQRHAALEGLIQFDSDRTIEPLWRLLEQFENHGDREGSFATRTHLLSLLARGRRSVQSLNELPGRLAEHLSDEEIGNAYPFTPDGEIPSNLAHLLALERKSAANIKTSELRTYGISSWWRFVRTATKTTDPAALREWHNLPRDVQRPVLAVETQRLGQGWLLLGLSASLAASLVFVLQSPLGDQIPSLFASLNMLVLFAIVARILFWPLWRRIFKSQIDEFGWITRRLKSWFELEHRKLNSFTKAVKAIATGIPLTFALPLALFLTHPSWQGHEDMVWSAAFDPDESKILTSSYDGTARLFDAATGDELIPAMRHDGRVWSAVFSADGSKILTSSSDGTVRLFDAGTGRELIPSMRHDGAVTGAVFSPDETKILTSSDDWTAKLFDSSTGKELFPAMRHAGEIWSIVFNADGSNILTGSRDGRARLFDASTGKVLIPAMRHDDTVRRAIFSANGSEILTSSSDGTARLFDAGTGKELIPAMHHDEVATGLAFNAVVGSVFNANETQILTMSLDGSARLFDAGTGKELIPAMRHEGVVVSAVFNADETQVLTSSFDGTARLFDAGTGKEAIPAMRHEGNVRSAIFNADGSGILTSSSDGTARLFDASTGTELIPVMRHDGAVTGAVFNADETKILTSSEDGKARLFNADTGALLFMSPTPFWDDSTWNWYDLLVWALLVAIFFFVPTLQWFDRGRIFYLRKPNRFLTLLDQPGVDAYLPDGFLDRRRAASGSGTTWVAPAVPSAAAAGLAEDAAPYQGKTKTDRD